MGSPLELARNQTGQKGKVILQMLLDKAESPMSGSFSGVAIGEFAIRAHTEGQKGEGTGNHLVSRSS